MTRGVCARPVGDVDGETVLIDEDATRVIEIDLGPGRALPWHFHTNLDRMYCLTGELVVETRMPLVRHVLSPGQHCQVPARKAHRVKNESAAPARYLIVQWGAPYDYFPVEALNREGAEQ